MTKQWFAPLFVLLAGCGGTITGSKATAVVLHGQRFSTELATDSASREHGLMMRTSLASGHGMLFVFPQAAPRAFWMKNTLIPLDILYFDADRRLASMQLDVPPCKASPCPVYPAEAPARYVLELSAGTVRRIGAKMGDELKIEGDVGPVH